MENKSKINSLMKILVLIMLGIYLVIYVVPLGAYDKEVYNQISKTAINFDDTRMVIAIAVGGACTLMLITLYSLRNSDVLAYSLISFIAGIIHIVLIRLGCNKFIEIFGDIDTSERVRKYIFGFEIVLYILVAAVSFVFLVVSVIRIIDYIKNIKRYNSQNEFIQIKEIYVEPRIIKLRENMNELSTNMILIFAFLLTALSVASFQFQGMLGTILGYALPMVLFLILFLKRWINSGKWINVIISYGVFAYMALDIIHCIFVPSVCNIFRYIMFKEPEYKIAMLQAAAFTVIFSVLCIVTVISVFCWAIEKGIMKDDRLSRKFRGILCIFCFGIFCLLNFTKDNKPEEKDSSYMDAILEEENRIRKEYEESNRILYNLMESHNKTANCGIYDIILEKVYYEKYTGEGCMVISVKSTDGSDISESYEYEERLGNLQFGEYYSGSRQYTLSFLSEGSKCEVIDNVIYITAYIHTAGIREEYVDKIPAVTIYDNTLTSDAATADEKDTIVGEFYLPDTENSRTFRINKYADVYVSSTSIYSEYNVISLSIVFKDGSELILSDAGKIQSDNIVDATTQYKKFVFVEELDVEEVDYVKFNGEKLEEK